MSRILALCALAAACLAPDVEVDGARGLEEVDEAVVLWNLEEIVCAHDPRAHPEGSAGAVVVDGHPFLPWGRAWAILYLGRFEHFDARAALRPVLEELDQTARAAVRRNLSERVPREWRAWAGVAE